MTFGPLWQSTWPLQRRIPSGNAPLHETSNKREAIYVIWIVDSTTFFVLTFLRLMWIMFCLMFWLAVFLVWGLFALGRGVYNVAKHKDAGDGIAVPHARLPGVGTHS